jgi:hypothetical protein
VQLTRERARTAQAEKLAGNVQKNVGQGEKVLGK